MKHVFQNNIERDGKAFVLVCDDLHAINQLMVLRYKEWTSAEQAARYQGALRKRQAENTLEALDLGAQATVRVWREVACEERFAKMFSQVEELASSDPRFSEILQRFVGSHNDILRRVLHPQAAELERSYILNEIAMSTYVTEILGYPTEIWETAPKQNLPDPLGFLYRERTDWLMNILEVSKLSRQLRIVKRVEVE